MYNLSDPRFDCDVKKLLPLLNTLNHNLPQSVNFHEQRLNSNFS